MNIGLFDRETYSLISRMYYSPEQKGSDLQEVAPFSPQLDCMSLDRGIVK